MRSMVVGCLSDGRSCEPWLDGTDCMVENDSQDWRQFGGDQASHHQLASPIGPPPFKGRTVGGVPVLGRGRTVCAGPLGMIGRTVGVVPVLWGGQESVCPPFKGRGTMRSMVVGCLGDR